MLALHYKSYQSHSPLLVLLTRQQHMQTMPRDVTVPTGGAPAQAYKSALPPSEDNCAKIEQWLLDYYKASVFNTCEHQPLPMMSGPPIRIMVDQNTTPVAHHTPIPVPVHWQEAVKAGLDRDVELGVIEPVPVGTPVTWCSRMVIASKKSGEPRRTVDFQALNRNAVRETHHIPSPSHLARSVPPNTCKTGKGMHPFDFIISSDVN